LEKQQEKKTPIFRGSDDYFDNNHEKEFPKLYSAKLFKSFLTKNSLHIPHFLENVNESKSSHAKKSAIYK